MQNSPCMASRKLSWSCPVFRANWCNPRWNLDHIIMYTYHPPLEFSWVAEDLSNLLVMAKSLSGLSCISASKLKQLALAVEQPARDSDLVGASDTRTHIISSASIRQLPLGARLSPAPRAAIPLCRPPRSAEPTRRSPTAQLRHASLFM